MNRFLAKVDFERASVPMSKRVRIFYMTQAAVSPPTFILFTDRDVKLHFAYQRFLENQIREAFGFVGSPIWIKTRATKRTKRQTLVAESRTLGTAPTASSHPSNSASARSHTMACRSFLSRTRRRVASSSGCNKSKVMLAG